MEYNSTEKLEFSLNEQQSGIGMYRPIKSPKTGVKFLIAILSLENVMLKGKLRQQQSKNSFLEVLRGYDSHPIPTQIEGIKDLQKNLLYYQKKCHELKNNVSKLRVERDGLTIELAKAKRTDRSKEISEIAKRSKTTKLPRNDLSGEKTVKKLKSDERDFRRERQIRYLKSLPIASFIDHSRLKAIDEKDGYKIKEFCFLKLRFLTLSSRSTFFEADGFSNFKFNEKRKTLKLEKRWPSNALTKNQFTYERELFDFEREIFFKRKLRCLMSSILRENQRRLKLLKVVSFYKLIAAPIFSHYSNQGIGLGHHEQSQFITNSFFLLDNSKTGADYFPLVAMEHNDRKALKHDNNRRQQEDSYLIAEEEKAEIADKTGGAFIQKERNLRKQIKDERKTHLLKRVFGMMKKRELLESKNRLFQWYKATQNAKISEMLEEFESINIVLSERAFREKLFRTKIKLLQQQIETQIGGIREAIGQSQYSGDGGELIGLESNVQQFDSIESSDYTEPRQYQDQEGSFIPSITISTKFNR